MQDRERAAYNKIEQYNSSNAAQHGNQGMGKNMVLGAMGSYGFDPSDNLSKFNLIPTTQQHLSQSSTFSTFDTFTNRNGGVLSEPLRLDQMVTLAVFKSTSGTIKKMLHGPSLKIYCVKEVPLANREIRKILKVWINLWEKCCTSEYFIRIYDTFWLSPEGCVSVVSDFAANGSLQNLITAVGALPESTLQHLSRQVLHALEFFHDMGITHSGVTASQIVFDRRGRVRISPAFGHILRSKNDTVSSLDQHMNMICILSRGTTNFKNRQQLLKDKFTIMIN